MVPQRAFLIIIKEQVHFKRIGMENVNITWNKNKEV